MPSNLCGICNGRVAIGLQCAVCNYWYHCNDKNPCQQKTRRAPFVCTNCRSTLTDEISEYMEAEQQRQQQRKSSEELERAAASLPTTAHHRDEAMINGSAADESTVSPLAPNTPSIREDRDEGEQMKKRAKNNWSRRQRLEGWTEEEVLFGRIADPFAPNEQNSKQGAAAGASGGLGSGLSSGFTSPRNRRMSASPHNSMNPSEGWVIQKADTKLDNAVDGIHSAGTGLGGAIAGTETAAASTAGCSPTSQQPRKSFSHLIVQPSLNDSHANGSTLFSSAARERPGSQIGRPKPQESLLKKLDGLRQRVEANLVTTADVIDIRDETFFREYQHFFARERERQNALRQQVGSLAFMKQGGAGRYTFIQTFSRPLGHSIRRNDDENLCSSSGSSDDEHDANGQTHQQQVMFEGIDVVGESGVDDVEDDSLRARAKGKLSFTFGSMTGRDFYAPNGSIDPSKLSGSAKEEKRVAYLAAQMKGRLTVSSLEVQEEVKEGRHNSGETTFVDPLENNRDMMTLADYMSKRRAKLERKKIRAQLREQEKERILAERQTLRAGAPFEMQDNSMSGVFGSSATGRTEDDESTSLPTESGDTTPLSAGSGIPDSKQIQRAVLLGKNEPFFDGSSSSDYSSSDESVKDLMLQARKEGELTKERKKELIQLGAMRRDAIRNARERRTQYHNSTNVTSNATVASLLTGGKPPQEADTATDPFMERNLAHRKAEILAAHRRMLFRNVAPPTAAGGTFEDDDAAASLGTSTALNKSGGARAVSSLERGDDDDAMPEYLGQYNKNYAAGKRGNAKKKLAADGSIAGGITVAGGGAALRVSAIEELTDDDR